MWTRTVVSGRLKIVLVDNDEKKRTASYSLIDPPAPCGNGDLYHGMEEHHTFNAIVDSVDNKASASSVVGVVVA